MYPFVFSQGPLPTFFVLPDYFLDLIRKFDGHIVIMGDDIRFDFTLNSVICTLDLECPRNKASFDVLLSAVCQHLLSIEWIDSDPSPPLPSDVGITTISIDPECRTSVDYVPPPDYIAPPPVTLIGYIIFLGGTPVYLCHSPFSPNPHFEYLVESCFLFRTSPVLSVPVRGTITCTRPNHFVIISNTPIAGKTVVTITRPANDPRPIEVWTDNVINNFRDYNR